MKCILESWSKQSQVETQGENSAINGVAQKPRKNVRVVNATVTIKAGAFLW